MKLYHLASHLHFTVPMTTAFHPHIHSGPNPQSALPTVNQHSIFHSQDRPFPHMVISFPVTLFPSQNAESLCNKWFLSENKGLANQTRTKQVAHSHLCSTCT